MHKPALRIALIGSGFIGRAYALAFRAAERTFDLGVTPVLDLIVDQDEPSAARAAAALGFARSIGDWRAAVADPAIDLVVIATPNLLHAPIALASLAAGKAVHCEKPLATRLDDARAMVDAAASARAVTSVGFTYLHNPMIALARDLIASGEIGTVTAFRGIHAEDFMASPAAPFNWRCEQEQAGGALADLGSHIIAMAHHLIGEVEAVQAQLHTVHRHRMDAGGQKRPIAVDDQVDALVRFANGATGTLSASWIATGRKMGLAFEISGTEGSISFDQARLNELKIFRAGDARLEGFATILAGPQHGDYGAFCPASGHQIGYNDLKTLEVKALIDAIEGKSSNAAPFSTAFHVDKVADAMRSSGLEAAGRVVATGIDAD